MMAKKPVRPLRNLAATITVLTDRNATVASVTLVDTYLGVLDGGMGTATGSCKREQGDVYDETIALDLAVGRALIKLGWHMVRRAHRNVTSATLAKRKKEILRSVRGPRHAKPGGQIQLPVILEVRGLEAAKRAARRRGDRAALAALVAQEALIQNAPPDAGSGPQVPGGGYHRDNGLPTIESNTKETS
jgi:hypothetical protein